MKVKYINYALQGELRRQGFKDVAEVIDSSNPDMRIGTMEPEGSAKRGVLFDFKVGGQKAFKFRKIIGEILSDIYEEETLVVVELPKKKPH